MLEFVTQETDKCPYCQNSLGLSTIDGIDYWKTCLVCNKRFEIAEFTAKRVENLLKETQNDR